MSDPIGRSRKQRVFVAIENTIGTLVYPATTDFILPAGDAIMNQNPDFVDSDEKRDTLDVLDRFQNAMPAADWNIPMFARAAALGSNPQGHALFRLLQHGVNAATAGSLSQGVYIADTEIHFSDLAGGVLPEKGVVLIGTEHIRYGTLTLGATGVTGMISDLTRGYAASTAADNTNGTDITLKSVFYKQDTDSPTASIWIETDHFVQGLSGATVNTCGLGVDNEGAVLLNFSGQGMEMIWAGTSALATNATIAVTTILTVDDASLYSVGAYIQNSTKDVNNSGAGYEITAVDTTLNQITIATVAESAWATDDVIKGYLPDETITGTVLESRDTAVEMDGNAAKFKTMDITIGTPKVYVEDEVGTDYPEDFIEDVRSIDSTLAVYFRKSDVAYFTDGYAGNEITLLLTFGDTEGQKMEIYAKKVSIEVPTVNFAPPAVELNMPMKILGTSGEDSLEICFH